VDVYADGRMDCADAERSTGTTTLGWFRCPSVDYINLQPVFDAQVIDAEEFDRVWREALSSHGQTQ
jgi:hypothetical protein